MLLIQVFDNPLPDLNDQIRSINANKNRVDK